MQSFLSKYFRTVGFVALVITALNLLLIAVWISSDNIHHPVLMVVFPLFFIGLILSYIGLIVDRSSLLAAILATAYTLLGLFILFFM